MFVFVVFIFVFPVIIGHFLLFFEEEPFHCRIFGTLQRTPSVISPKILTKNIDFTTEFFVFFF